MEEKIPLSIFLWVMGFGIAFVTAWLWRLHDGHHALRIKVAETCATKDDVHVMVKEFKEDNIRIFNELKVDMRNDRLEIMGAIGKKQDKP